MEQVEKKYIIGLKVAFTASVCAFEVQKVMCEALCQEFKYDDLQVMHKLILSEVSKDEPNIEYIKHLMKELEKNINSYTPKFEKGGLTNKPTENEQN